jgi:hypothetical protein
VAGLDGQTGASRACSPPTTSDGKRRPVGYQVPSGLRRSGPTQPTVASASPVASIWASAPRGSRVSGLSASTQALEVAAAPAFIALAYPSLVGFSITLRPSERATSAEPSREALSTTTTSTPPGGAAWVIDSTQPGRSAALS